ncbi:MAG: prepilin-type N-terminal cleavage/methylation domain-containing protein [Saprospiraceae bacterium]|nr:prepilin-type N-terminal cleavage/methylation domain-containing protein [Saprospiraceae bacterium]MCB0624816.1 prepilin-type N-terminal cleavage/methylation domain-containing protein [Saprospiraceae bacterium]MCB0684583.1 prepilin-type N-terminal cleavage/methylation domain-containing protein [Saprospiraceae bacterium]
MTTSKRTLAAFTLTELLVVLVIIGILMLIALPNLMPLIAKTHSLEAQQALTTIQKLQRSYYQQHLAYSDDLVRLGFEPEPTQLEGGGAKYAIWIVESSTEGFVARAEAIVDFDKDGILNQWEIRHVGEPVELVRD